MLPDALGQALIDRFQRHMPVTERPYAAMAEALGVTEQDILGALEALRAGRIISRVGPVFDHARAGASMLVAAAVPAARLDTVADIVSAFDCVNHNYAREHRFNLWFVVTAADSGALAAELDRIERAAGVTLLRLPMERAYHIDLAFDIDWQRCADAEPGRD